MFTSIEISLVRERNERLRQEIKADRVGRRLGPGRTFRGLWPRRFALLSGRPRRAGVGGGA